MEQPTSKKMFLLHEILCAEALAVRGTAVEPGAGPQAGEPDTRLPTVYAKLGNLRSAALCLSGGGIRSAAFSLGVIQALAASSKDKPAAQPGASPDSKPVAKLETIQDSLLSEFHYLSTVSGGGYIGSWLSKWISVDGDKFWHSLIDRPGGPDVEPNPLQWLRANSNYLTPKLGATSADAWADIALWIRNLLLNWLVILPVLLVAIFLIKWLLVFTSAAHRITDPISLVPLAIAAALIIFATWTELNNSPTARQSKLTQPQFLATVLLPALISAFLISLAVGTQGFFEHVQSWDRPKALTRGALCLAAVYAVSWLLSIRRKKGLVDLAAWLAGGAVFGALLGLGMFTLNHFEHLNLLLLTVGVPDAKGVVLFVYGVPWVLFAQLMGEMTFIGLTSYQTDSDEDREWFGRAAGWFTATIIIWLLATLLCVVAAHFVATQYDKLGALFTAISGAVTAFLGKSSFSPAQGVGKGSKGRSTNFILAIAAPLFAALLVIGGSVISDQLLLGHPLLDSALLEPDKTLNPAPAAAGKIPTTETATISDRPAATSVPAAPTCPPKETCPPASAIEKPTKNQDCFWLLVGLFGTLAVGALASWRININRFSLHALYRNRLIRAFLGATTENRTANPFTNFTVDDNPPMASLWKRHPPCWQPFHVINIALNIVSTKRLAWQERKAEPFTVTPLHSGSSCLAYRSSSEYGGAKGISVGTAMAISGAAASPNMGYHSSAPLSFLMALLNVRLGWWFGNPGEHGARTYDDEGPDFAVTPLLMEAFGLTTDDKQYVYLSDGGHFENLGIYEMVRRRCRYIVAIDAGCDPEYKFADLGNAVRKISIDMNVRIEMKGLERLRPRAADGTPPVGSELAYHAYGIIQYPEADHTGEPGILLYVKPGYHGTEAADIQSYAMANTDFPHQSTGDQWFSESQFESYRALGYEIMSGVIGELKDHLESKLQPTLAELLEKSLSAV